MSEGRSDVGQRDIVGPAVIEEAAAVTLVRPEDTIEVNAFGHLVMRLAVTP